MSQTGSRSAYLKARNVFDCWVLALRVHDLIVEGRIKKEWLNTQAEIKFSDGNSGIKISPTKYVDTIVKISENLTRTALGTCFIAFDEALTDLFGDLPKDTNNDLDSLRIIIHLMRCSFAHNPAEPKWDIRLNNRKKIKIQKINFVIDFGQLNGKLVKFEHHDGSEGLTKLMSYCFETIKNEENINLKQV